MIWRPAARDDRQIASLWVVCAVSTVALRPLWIAAAAILPPCLWHRATGLPCPGCGATRAILSLLQGRIAAALAFNPLAACAAIGFVALGVAAPIWLAAGGRVPVVPAKPRPAWLAAAASVLAANWVWLAVSGV
jgi:hypothetical protein